MPKTTITTISSESGAAVSIFCNIMGAAKSSVTDLAAVTAARKNTIKITDLHTLQAVENIKTVF